MYLVSLTAFPVFLHRILHNFLVFLSFKPCRRQAKQTLKPCTRQSSKTNVQEYTTAKLKTLATTVWKWCQFWKSSRSADRRCRRQDTTEASILPPQKTTLPFRNDANFGNHHALQTDAADGKIKPKPRYCLLKKQHFCNFSLVSLSVYPRSHRGAERIRQGEGRWSFPPKTALERSDLTEKFQFRESHTEAETKKNSWPNYCPLKRKQPFYIYVWLQVWQQRFDIITKCCSGSAFANVTIGRILESDFEFVKKVEKKHFRQLLTLKSIRTIGVPDVKWSTWISSPLHRT